MGAEGNAPSPPVCKTGILLLDEAPSFLSVVVSREGLAPPTSAFSTQCLCWIGLPGHGASDGPFTRILRLTGSAQFSATPASEKNFKSIHQPDLHRPSPHYQCGASLKPMLWWSFVEKSAPCRCCPGLPCLEDRHPSW